MLQKTLISDIIKGPWYISIQNFKSIIFYFRFSRTAGVLVNRSFSLFNAFEILARGSHKVCVCDDRNKIQSFLTQSMVIKYIWIYISIYI